MKILSIQIHHRRLEDSDVNELVSLAKNLIEESLVSKEIKVINKPEEDYTDIHTRAEDLKSEWGKLKSAIDNNAQLKNSSIIVCEGEKGWEDYLLLHHYDENERIDSI